MKKIAFSAWERFWRNGEYYTGCPI